MRWCVSVGAVLVAGAIVGGEVAGIAAPSPKSRFADTKHNVPAVNVELVIAVDVSYSMDMDELAIQREGYAQAIVSKDFLQALRAGPGSKVAVTYFEWSMSGDEKIIIPWRVIDGPESADAVAAEIMKTPVRRASSTSISGAISFALQLFEESPYRGLRRVIDISGDGPNNDGAPVTSAQGFKSTRVARTRTVCSSSACRRGSSCVRGKRRTRSSGSTRSRWRWWSGSGSCRRRRSRSA